MITLYGYNFRSRAERVEWALNELGLEYEFIRLDPMIGDTSTEEFLALNPSRKIPVLVHNGIARTESLAIMEYLNSVSQDKKIIPMDVEGSYQMRRAIHFVATELEAYLWIADQCERLQKKYPWPEGTKEESLKRVVNNLPNLDSIVGDSEFAAGDEFSVADIYLYHCLMWALAHGIKLPRNCISYLRRLRTRPGIPESLKG